MKVSYLNLTNSKKGERCSSTSSEQSSPEKLLTTYDWGHGTSSDNKGAISFVVAGANFLLHPYGFQTQKLLRRKLHCLAISIVSCRSGQLGIFTRILCQLPLLFS